MSQKKNKKNKNNQINSKEILSKQLDLIDLDQTESLTLPRDVLKKLEIEENKEVDDDFETMDMDDEFEDNSEDNSEEYLEVNADDNSEEYPEADAGNNSKDNNSNKKKSKGKYYMRFLIMYLIILLIVIGGVWGIIWNKLEAYQMGIDIQKAGEAYLVSENRAPQLAFTDEISEMTVEQWMELWMAEHPEDYNGQENLEKYFEENFDSAQLSYYKASSYSKETPVYLLKNNEMPLVEITMQGQALDWKISQTNFMFEGKQSASIEVPSKYSVFCNGIPAFDTDRENIDGIPVEDYEDALVNPVVYCKYTFEGLFYDPEIEVEAPDGYASATDVYGNYYLTLDDAMAAGYQQQADAFIHALLHYYSYGKNSLSENMIAVSSHVAAGSAAQTIIKQAQDGLQWVNYDGANYVTSTSSVYVLADNCYAVDVSYENTNANSNMAPGIYRVFFLDLGSGFKIYNFALYQ